MKSLEEQTLSGICCNLLIGYCITDISVNFNYRHAVATRVWIDISFNCNGKSYSVSGSSIGIVKGRLIELIDRICTVP